MRIRPTITALRDLKKTTTMKEDAHAASASLKSLRHHYREDDKGFKEAKDLLTHFVAHSKSQKDKQLKKLEASYLETKFDDNTYWDATVEEKIEPPPKDEDHPLVFYPEEETEEWKCQKRQEWAKKQCQEKAKSNKTANRDARKCPRSPDKPSKP